MRDIFQKKKNCYKCKKENVTFLLFTKERRLLKKKSEEHQNSRENKKLMEWKRVCPFHTKQQNCRIVFEIG
jgi:hypothetical protein